MSEQGAQPKSDADEEMARYQAARKAAGDAAANAAREQAYRDAGVPMNAEMTVSVETADASMLSVKKGEAPDKKSSAYRPSSSGSWGVFPRPKNISKEYGGGRTIRPGEELEPEEVTEAREKRMAEKLQAFKVKAGLVVPEEVSVLYDEGFSRAEQLMARGDLLSAAAAYEEAAALLVERSPKAGMALLQQAICLDSAGRADKARPIYEQLRRHPDDNVRKKAEQMAFGFEASTFLKVDKMDSAIDPKRYDPFLMKFNPYENESRGFIFEEEDTRALDAVATAAALAVVALPVALFALIKLGAGS